MSEKSNGAASAAPRKSAAPRPAAKPEAAKPDAIDELLDGDAGTLGVVKAPAAPARVTGLAPGRDGTVLAIESTGQVAKVVKALEVTQDSRRDRVIAIPPDAQVMRHTTDASVEFSRNGKGEPSWSVKLSVGPGETIEDAVSHVLEMDERFRLRTGKTPGPSNAS